ncbi:hypothetical protein MTP99_017248 [Tenebrio molitor]|nr:hypothetical protein MTP99_017248 [Tenebrio molitor]
MVESKRVIGDDLSRYHRPNRQADSDGSPDRTLSGSSPRQVPASQDRLLAHRKVPELPANQVRSSGDTFLLFRPCPPHLFHI